LDALQRDGARLGQGRRFFEGHADRLWCQEEAAGWTQERGLTPQDEVSCLREGDHLVLARVLLAQSQPDQALGLLERIDALADSQGRTASLIGIRALLSLAYSTDAKRLGEGRSRGQTRRDADVVPCRPLRHVAVP
jgi:MalT-like TPR region